MKSKNAKRTVKANVWDPKKDNLFKELAEILAAVGVTVRREELKRGPGWRVSSGACRIDEGKFLFVDRKLAQDDQIAFVAQRIAMLKVEIAEEKFATFPEKIQSVLRPPAQRAA